MKWGRIGSGIFLFIISLLFFWLIILKVVSRAAARFDKATPCPASLSWLVDNRWRKRSMRHVLDWVGIQEGERVLELGPGPGVFTAEAARRVGSRGRLIAVDIQPAMIEQLDARLRREGIRGVETYVGDGRFLPLDDDSIDRAFLISVLPEIADIPQVLVELKRILKPDAILSLTSEFTDPDYLFLGEIVKLLERSGFSLTERFGNLWLYSANFRNRDDRPAGSSYYVLRKKRLMKEFDSAVERVRPLMQVRYGSDFIDLVVEEAKLIFERLIPQIPYIGGRGNSFTRNLIQSTWSLALYRTMTAYGRSTEEVGKLLVDVYTSWLEKTPDWQLRIKSWFAFTPIARWHLDKRADKSRKGRYSGDWVFTTVGRNSHDIGVD